MNTRQDITEYSDNELSLIVMNTEDLYNLTKESVCRYFFESVYIFTDKQWEVLLEDLND